MAYENELHFMKSVFAKCRLQLLVLDANIMDPTPLDKQLRSTLGRGSDYDIFFRNALMLCAPNTLHTISDHYQCTYLFWQPPDQPEQRVIVGPMLRSEPDDAQIYEIMERTAIDPQHRSFLLDYYARLPVINSGNSAFDMLEAYAELIWGGPGGYTTLNFNREVFVPASPILRGGTPAPNDILQSMQQMEQRYATENELMQMISMGLSHKADQIIHSLPVHLWERRLSDPVRNIQNYCVITNTLMRKAAERGGVHPLYLDSVSAEFTRKLDGIGSVEAGQAMILEMSRSYCRLVKRHSTMQYSLPVQKTIIFIDSDLSANLSLKTLADLLNINASYLSSLFKRETGQTLTDFVNHRRVKLAVHLLSTTKLQVQTIAQHCGIPDINYFSKIFKKYTHQTPKEYRKNLHSHL